MTSPFLKWMAGNIVNLLMFIEFTGYLKQINFARRLSFEEKRIMPVRLTLAPCVGNLKTYFYTDSQMSNRKG
jgi:hypothetical protein